MLDISQYVPFAPQLVDRNQVSIVFNENFDYEG